MALDGEAIYDLFYLTPKAVPDTVVLDLPDSALRDCCGAFSLKVLADTASDDTYKNDVNGPVWWFPGIVDTAVLKLFKFDDTTGEYEEIADLIDNTYGELFDYQFFTNDVGENFIGYQISWKAILTAFGEGGYTVKCDVTDTLGGSSTLTWYPFCLKQYTPARADGTVRIEYYLNGQLGISDNDYAVKDFGTINWYNSFRLPGFFSFDKSTYQRDFNKYNNGRLVDVKHEQDPEYTLKTRPIAGYIHEVMRTDVMMADSIFITDYNSKNALPFVRKEVKADGEYAPGWKKLQSKLAPLEMKFKQGVNNLKKRKC